MKKLLQAILLASGCLCILSASVLSFIKARETVLGLQNKKQMLAKILSNQ